MNEYTVTLADASSHSIAQAHVAAKSKLEAALAVMENLTDEPMETAPLVDTDTWTITITQP